MAKRQRVDSPHEGSKILQAGLSEIKPPPHISLADSDLPYWHSVLAEFPKADWTNHNLEVAAQLAKAMSDIESERAQLRVEGFVLGPDITGLNKPITNPRHNVVRDMVNSIMSLRRNLQLHARARGGESREVGKRKALGKSIESGAGDFDGLIARPDFTNQH